MRLVLNDADDTMRLGRLLAQTMTFSSSTELHQGEEHEGWALPAIYLYGDLGSGKTTFARGFVEALPGGDEAEVASPSFTLCNEYPTVPRVLHADLYRLNPCAALPGEVEEACDRGFGEEGPLLLLEWPERLASAQLAANRLDVALEVYPVAPPGNLDILTQPCERKRLACVTAHGRAAERLLEALRPRLESCFAAPSA